MNKLTNAEFEALERALLYVLDYGDDEDEEWHNLNSAYVKLISAYEYKKKEE